ncbi:unnamed protein product, partial [Amoebophrya sp. A25]
LTSSKEPTQAGFVAEGEVTCDSSRKNLTAALAVSSVPPRRVLSLPSASATNFVGPQPQDNDNASGSSATSASIIHLADVQEGSTGLLSVSKRTISPLEEAADTSPEVRKVSRRSARSMPLTVEELQTSPSERKSSRQYGIPKNSAATQPNAEPDPTLEATTQCFVEGGRRQ